MIDNKALLAEIILCKKSKQVSRKLGEMLIKITKYQLLKPNYRNFTYKDDMTANAHFHLYKVILKFDPTKSSNPFAFCVTVISSAFCYIINSNRKQMIYYNLLYLK